VYLSPSWLLMLWTGLAALLAAAAIIAPLAGSTAPRGALLFFRPAGFVDFLLLLLLGLVLYPLVYGTIFDLLHVATILSGAGVGAAHAAVLLLVQPLTHRRIDAPAVTVLTCLVYGIVMGFLYVTP
jgi:hypothetical protein